MQVNWILINSNDTHIEVSLTEAMLPVLGNSKYHAGQNYEVKHVLAKRVAGRSPMVIAVQQAAEEMRQSA